MLFDNLIPHLTTVGAALDSHFNRVIDRLEDIAVEVRAAAPEPEYGDNFLRAQTGVLAAGASYSLGKVPAGQIWTLAAISPDVDTGATATAWRITANGISIIASGGAYPQAIPLMPGEEIAIVNPAGAAGAAAFLAVFQRKFIADRPARAMQGREQKPETKNTGEIQRGNDPRSVSAPPPLAVEKIS